VITVSGNHASRVFDIAAGSAVDISGLTIADGYLMVGVPKGAGILNAGTLNVTACAVTNNSTGGSMASFGGGISNSGTLTLTNSTIRGNTAVARLYNSGGGIANYGTLTVTNSIINGNSAIGGSEGGAIVNISATLTITDSTLSGTSAGNRGGGISSATALLGTVTITASTISDNSAGDSAGGIFFSNTTVTIDSMILAGNMAPSSPDVVGVLTSRGYNLIGDGTGGGGYEPTDLVGTSQAPIDPLLGPVQDNGGPTETMALLPGSPALNAGDPTQLGVADQRGVVRTGGVNIGAYQASATAFVLAASNTVSSGVPFDVTVTAVDPFGQVALGYTGTVTFSTTDLDPGVVLPADYTFTPDDQGMHTFTNTGLGEITLITPGVQMLTATDTTDNTITGSTAVTVTSPHAPEAGRLTSSPVEREREAPTSLMTSSVLSRAETAALDLASAALHQEETSGTVW
jgi:hypothetical protein